MKQTQATTDPKQKAELIRELNRIIDDKEVRAELGGHPVSINENGTFRFDTLEQVIDVARFLIDKKDLKVAAFNIGLEIGDVRMAASKALKNPFTKAYVEDSFESQTRFKGTKVSFKSNLGNEEFTGVVQQVRNGGDLLLVAVKELNKVVNRVNFQYVTSIDELIDHGQAV